MNNRSFQQRFPHLRKKSQPAPIPQSGWSPPSEPIIQEKLKIEAGQKKKLRPTISQAEQDQILDKISHSVSML